MTIVEAASKLRSKQVSSVELTRASIDSIARLNPKLNAFITVLEQPALRSARAADAELAGGKDRGPLHGIPVALKDVFETKDVRTTCGSVFLKENIPSRDCAVAEKLQQAGAVLIGKTGLHEFAYGITSDNPHFGTIRNPWGADRVPGGSSGGSGSAVASDQVFMAMGSDTGGSIRIPASFCGIVGLKPTFGRVSRYGVLPLDYSLDHMGPLVRSVRDAGIVLNALAGHDSRDDTSSRRPVKDYVPHPGASISGLRLGLSENFYFDRVDDAAAAGVRAMASTAQRLGAQILPVRVPDIAALNTIGRLILLVEASSCLAPYLDRRDQFGKDVLALLDQGRLIPGTDYVHAQRLRRVMQAEFRKLFEGIDCLLTPATPTGAPRIGQTTVKLGDVEEDVRLASTRFVRGINVLGLPALSIPCGLDAEGMPLGLQIIGRAFEEDVILKVGAALEDATDHHRHRPAIL